MFADKKILITHQYSIVILDEQLTEIEEIYPNRLHSCKPPAVFALADSLNTSHFLLVLDLDNQLECKHHYNGFNYTGSNGWVTEACFSSDTNQIILQDPTEKSILCENEQVFSLIQVAKDKLVIHLTPKRHPSYQGMGTNSEMYRSGC